MNKIIKITEDGVSIVKLLKIVKNIKFCKKIQNYSCLFIIKLYNK